MLEAHVHPDTSVTLATVLIPKISEPNDILVRVVCASCNPKDWKMPAGLLKTIADCPNSGDDLAGVVEKVGAEVASVKPGDRVAALHQLGAPYGAYAEFALVKDFVCFKIPDTTSFEEAATVPMAAYMACIALFGLLKVCAGPWEIVREETPLLIYGAATGVGSMAVKLAQLVNVHPVINIAGSGCDFVSGLIDKENGDIVFDYRKGDETVFKGVQSMLGGKQLEYAFDAVSEESSLANVAKILKPGGGRIALTLPGRAHKLPEGLNISHAMAGSLWNTLAGRDEDEELGNLGLEEGGPTFARAMTSSIEGLLSDGLLKPHPHTVYRGGLNGVEPALKALRAGKVSASRCVVQVGDTPGIQTEKHNP
ncbi:uncharacterized protein LTR77_009415 [Saxophila tyrrhenica]|uniref:Enoyl reductase (ER) domain-containing protein n=1 Tax=Saxophila tyrrhenica TaxID=1690608 RepID=A0AAV9P1G4_9PEZI|nr:hypothetical protein LTR77_009415 [Saxophila tyrrhenica]